MRVDLSCPVEPRGYEITYDDVGKVRANVDMFNLATRRVVGFEAVVQWRNSETGEIAAVPFEASDVRAGARKRFSISISNDIVRRADVLELNFRCVRFDDGEREWRAGNGMIVDINRAQPLSGPELNALFAVVGEDAVRFPCEDEQTWTCVCGRVNPKGKAKCARCRRVREDVLENLTRERVLQAGMSAEVPVDLDDEPLAERRKRRMYEALVYSEYIKKRKSLIRRLISAGIVIAALFVLMWFLDGKAECAGSFAMQDAKAHTLVEFNG